MGNFKTRTCLEYYAVPEGDHYTFTDPQSGESYRLELLEDDLVVCITFSLPCSAVHDSKTLSLLDEINSTNHFGYFSLTDNNELQLRATLWIGSKMSDKVLKQLITSAAAHMTVVAQQLLGG